MAAFVAGIIPAPYRDPGYFHTGFYAGLLRVHALFTFLVSDTAMPCRPRLVPARKRHSLKGLETDRRGGVLVEFGLLAPPFVALLIAVLVMGVTSFAQQCIQTTADAMARKVLTGQTQLAGTTKEDFRLQACATLPTFLKCDRLIVDLQKANSFQDIDVSNPKITYDGNGAINNSWSYSPGNAGDIVILRVMYLWPVSTGPLGFDIANLSRGRRLLLGTMVFKSESYS